MMKPIMTTQTAPRAHTTPDAWIAQEAIRFDPDDPAACDAAIDQLVTALDEEVALLGFGEVLHFGEEILTLRNRLFRRLVEAHGYSAIAVESSFPRGHWVNEYVLGRGPASYAAVQARGFSHGFGALDANRELVEWMRRYNADPVHRVKLHFYGFDGPMEMMSTDSPRQVLHFALDYLTALDPARGQARRARIDPLLGDDAAWENPAAMMDASQSIGLSDAANALRIETEELISELQIRRPEWVAQSDREEYLEALQHATVARQLLAYHAGVARESEQRIADLLGLRDALMADNLAYVAARERNRGKVLVFAHNRHLQYGQAQWQLGPHNLIWWSAGAQLKAHFGAAYAVIGSGVGISSENGIEPPESGTLEALLTAAPDAALFIPTHQGQALSPDVLDALPSRSGSTRNSTYMPLGPESLHDFDWLAVLHKTGYARGAPPLPEPAGGPTT